ncbi:GNAT family N-acetyltransferase [Photobacterium iliopiscarium]|uniref:GNAT family N-acetyltransferase n=1 Tax=Photobacterium iliopiscarium TaxID=56192 RepID=UPI002467BFE8|nr:GNAT family N-acetyltransferase [Photobacterium iliopiscarium]
MIVSSDNHVNYYLFSKWKVMGVLCFGITSGGLIARLAVDHRYKGQGFGEWLLIDALRKLLMASETVAFPVVIVDAKDGAEDFYEKYGFTAFKDADNKLFITIADIRASIGELI